jgi:hypothetical protein
MQGDPIVDEVRRVRREIERELGSDQDAFYRHLRQVQKAFGDRLVSRTPRKRETAQPKRTKCRG